MENKNLKSLFIFFGVITLFMGIVTFVPWTLNLSKSMETKNWSTTGGVILTSEISSHQESERDSNGHYRMVTYYSVNIVYQYIVNGFNYSCSRVSYSTFDSTSDHNEAQQLANKYSVGKNVTVYYNPNNPSEAVLETGSTNITYVFLILGVILTIAGIVFLYLAFRRKRENQNKTNL